jgi:hypothetical protein
MQYKITIVHSPTGHYVEFYDNFPNDVDKEDIVQSVLDDVYVEVEDV